MEEPAGDSEPPSSPGSPQGLACFFKPLKTMSQHELLEQSKANTKRNDLLALDLSMVQPAPRAPSRKGKLTSAEKNARTAARVAKWRRNSKNSELVPLGDVLVCEQACAQNAIRALLAG